jgi:hypothetical protein
MQKRRDNRAEAEHHYKRGDIPAAIKAMRSLVDSDGDGVKRDDLAFLYLLYFSANDYQSALVYTQQCHARFPDDVETIQNIGVCLGRMRRHAEAVKYLDIAAGLTPDDPVIHDALASAHHFLGNHDAAKAHGEQALTLKDRQAAAGRPIRMLDRVPIPPFDPSDPRRNVIAFSLWGRDERYTAGAVRNAEMVHEIYPGWHCRFYCDSTVAEDTIGRLIALGADVMVMPPQAEMFEGLFWRFRVASDPDIDRFLIRDADSIVNVRERAGVDEWLASDRHFHVMRDFATHTDPMLAGLWGGVRGALPDLTRRAQKYVSDIAKTANCDQKFLREVVWPVARQSYMAHDSVFEALDARPFPAGARLIPGRHVGQDAQFHPKPVAGKLAAVTAKGKVRTRRARQRYIFTITPGRSGTAYLAELLRQNVSDTEVHHERTGYQNFGVLTPDLSHFTLFNSVGNVAAVRAFWERKLGGLRYGETAHYAETSHLLAKAGLIENLSLLGPEADIHLVNLRRDLDPLVWSFGNRMDFINHGFTWAFTLDPDYPRNIADPRTLARFGVLGKCLWYAIEMQARGEFYRRLVADIPNVTFHDVDLEDIIAPSGAEALLTALGVATAGAPTIPDKLNAGVLALLGPEDRKVLDTMLARLAFDPADMADL